MKTNKTKINDKKIKEINMSKTATKTPYKFVEQQMKDGYLTQKQVDEMIAKGMCASPV